MSVFFGGSWGMNRSAEQTNRPRTTSQFTRFVCSTFRFIPHEPRKKHTHSLINYAMYNSIPASFCISFLSDIESHYHFYHTKLPLSFVLITRCITINIFEKSLFRLLKVLLHIHEYMYKKTQLLCFRDSIQSFSFCCM